MVVMYKGEVGGYSALGTELVERQIPIDAYLGRQSEHAFRKNVTENLVSSTRDPERRAPVPCAFDRAPLFSEHRRTQAAQRAQHVQRGDRGALALLRDDELCHRLLRSRHGPLCERGLIAV